MKKEEKKMTIDSHSRDSQRSHNRRYNNKYAKEKGKKMSQEEIDKEFIELKEQLNALRRMLEESHRLGQVLSKKPVKWHKLQRRLQQKEVKWLKGKLKEVEMEESICEPEQGEFLGDSEDEDLKTETSSKTKGSHGFKSNNLCMFAGQTCEGKFVDIVIKEEEEKQNLNYVLEEDGIDRSHIQLGKISSNQVKGLKRLKRRPPNNF